MSKFLAIIAVILLLAGAATGLVGFLGALALVFVLGMIVG